MLDTLVSTYQKLAVSAAIYSLMEEWGFKSSYFRSSSLENHVDRIVI